MTLRKKVFTSQKITIMAEPEVRVQALISPYGAKYLFREEEVPAQIANRMGEEFSVHYKSIPAKARFVKETTATGNIYNLRFLNPSNTLLKQIQRDLSDSGLPSPWFRNLPRLSTIDKQLPVPVLAVMYNRGETFFLSINDFTLGGVQLEFIGSELSGLQLGDTIEIDLVVNSGEKIADMSAEITRVTAEYNSTDGKSDRYLFGVKFGKMPLLSESKYKSLIKDHCIALKKDLQA